MTAAALPDPSMPASRPDGALRPTPLGQAKRHNRLAGPVRTERLAGMPPGAEGPPFDQLLATAEAVAQARPEVDLETAREAERQMAQGRLVRPQVDKVGDGADQRIRQQDAGQTGG